MFKLCFLWLSYMEEFLMPSLTEKQNYHQTIGEVRLSRDILQK